MDVENDREYFARTRLQEQVRLLTEASSVMADWTRSLEDRLAAAELKIIELERDRDAMKMGFPPGTPMPSRKESEPAGPIGNPDGLPDGGYLL